MNSVESNIRSLKYQMFTPSGCNDIGIRKLNFCGKNSIPLILNWNFSFTFCIFSVFLECRICEKSVNPLIFALQKSVQFLHLLALLIERRN